MNQVNSFIALTAPFPRNFLSNLFTAFEGKLLSSPGKLSLAKSRPYSIILDILALLRFMSVDILLAQVLLTLDVCLAVRNNLCGKFSS